MEESIKTDNTSRLSEIELLKRLEDLWNEHHHVSPQWRELAAFIRKEKRRLGFAAMNGNWIKIMKPLEGQ